MARSFAEGPAPLVADRVHNRHADDVFKLLQFPDNDCPMGPGAGPGDIEMVAVPRRLVAGITIRGDPVCKGIRLPDEATLDVLLVGKLCLNGHRRAPAYLYRNILHGSKGDRPGRSLNKILGKSAAEMGRIPLKIWI